jgi:hypothetical protein
MPAISGLIAEIDGKATPETLWAGKRLSTDNVTFYNLPTVVLTKDNYKEFFAQVLKDSGLS